MADDFGNTPSSSGGTSTLQKAPPEKPKDPNARTLPHALDAEKSILSTMMQDPEEYIGRAVVANLYPDHFYSPAHGMLYKLLIEFSEKNQPVELISLTQILKDRNLLDNIGGVGGLTSIHAYQATAAHFQFHLDLVRDKFILRSIISASTESITKAYDDPGDVADYLDVVEAKILQIRNTTENSVEETIKEVMGDVMTQLHERLAGKVEQLGISTGYKRLDEITQGLKAGEMFIIAARPSMGKTSFMMNIVEHVALDQNLPVLVFSCEMTTQQLVERLFYARASFDSNQIKKGFRPTEGEVKRLEKASQEIANSNIFIDPTPSISINEVRAKARRKHREDGIAMIAVDYLQLMRSESAKAEGSRQQEVSEISAGLKALAKELSIPVVILAQLNRGPETRTGGNKPRMSDLRESGSIEQDADVIGLLYRDQYYAQDDEAVKESEGLSELIIDKNRNGPTESIKLTFRAELMRFETRAYDPNADNQ